MAVAVKLRRYNSPPDFDDVDDGGDDDENDGGDDDENDNYDGR